MSDVLAPKSPLGIAAYGIAAALALFEVAVVWLMLHPDVSPDYRAYYIDRTTTCLNQPVTGAYSLGETVSFRDEGAEASKPLKVCGWQGPVGDGTHALGTSARLRFALPANTGALRVSMDLVAVERDGHPSQHVDVDVNGTMVGAFDIAGGAEQAKSFDVPADLVASHPNSLELTLHFPDAIKIGPNDANTYWRSIKLQSVRVEPN